MTKNHQNWFPITPKQRILVGVTPGSDSCMSTTTGFRICGPLDKKRLESVIQYVFDTNDALRFIFKRIGDIIYQAVLEKYEYKLTEYHLNGTSDSEKETELLLHSRSILHRCEQFDGTIMAQIVLYALSDSTHILFITMSHLISDGISGNILLKQINEAYNGRFSKCACQTYMDYLQEESLFAGTDEGKKQLDYWKTKSNGYDDTFWPKPIGERVESSLGFFFDLEFKPFLDFAQENKLSLAITNIFLSHIALSAAFSVSDTVIAIAESNRNVKCIETVGCCASYSFGRLIIDSDKTLFELLQKYVSKHNQNSKNVRLGAYLDIPKFAISYVNYAPDRQQQKWLFGDAYAEPCIGTFEGMRMVWNLVCLIIAEFKAQNKIIYSLGCDNQMFPYKYRRSFVFYFKKAFVGLISKTMTFRDLLS